MQNTKKNSIFALENMQKTAKIVNINAQGMLECEIECSTTCSGCAMKKACNPNSNKRKITLLNTLPPLANTGYVEELNVGDIIEIEVSNIMGLRAIFFAYLLPVILLIGTILCTLYAGVGELAQGLSAIGVLVIYFVAVKVFGIGRGVSIEILKKI